jgi:hypothetical protein
MGKGKGEQVDKLKALKWPETLKAPLMQSLEGLRHG